MFKKITLSVALLLAVTSLCAQVQFKDVELQKLFEMAKGEKKLAFVDLYATWCPPCKTMERDVFSREDVGAEMSKHFVSAKYNVEGTIGREMSKKYGVSSIPTYLIFDGSGKVVGRLQGSMPAATFIDKMKGIAAQSK
ncbi:MAG: thioredoxin fold domain-containing protein [Rikenellaceae bacterium]